MRCTQNQWYKLLRLYRVIIWEPAANISADSAGGTHDARINYSMFIWIRCITDESIREQTKQNSPRSQKYPKWPLLLRMHFLYHRKNALKHASKFISKAKQIYSLNRKVYTSAPVRDVSRTKLKPVIDTIQLLFIELSIFRLYFFLLLGAIKALLV
jgi:hypothetical protein